eukprot:scaffold187459_cov28-Tisochrysis_lutea.AAC.1
MGVRGKGGGRWQIQGPASADTHISSSKTLATLQRIAPPLPNAITHVHGIVPGRSQGAAALHKHGTGRACTRQPRRTMACVACCCDVFGPFSKLSLLEWQGSSGRQLPLPGLSS